MIKRYIVIIILILLIVPKNIYALRPPAEKQKVSALENSLSVIKNISSAEDPTNVKKALAAKKPYDAVAALEEGIKTVLMPIRHDLLEHFSSMNECLEPGDELLFDKANNENKIGYKGIGRFYYPKTKRDLYIVFNKKRYPVKFKDPSRFGEPQRIKDEILIGVDATGEGKSGIRWLTFPQFVTKKRVGVSLTIQTEYAKKMHESPYKFEIGGWIYVEDGKPEFHVFSSTTLYFDCNGNFDESGVAEETFLEKEDKDKLLFLFHTHADGEYPPWLSYFDLCTTLNRPKYGEPQADIVFNDNGRGRAFILKEGADPKGLISLMKKFEIKHKDCTEKEKYDFFMQHAGRIFIMYDIVLSPEGVEVSHIKSTGSISSVSTLSQAIATSA